MKQSPILIAILSSIIVPAAVYAARPSNAPKFKRTTKNIVSAISETDTVKMSASPIDSAFLRVREPEEIVGTLGNPDFKPVLANKVLGPWVFLGYKNIERSKPDLTVPTYIKGMEVLTNDHVQDSLIFSGEQIPDVMQTVEMMEQDSITTLIEETVDPIPAEPLKQVDILSPDITPKWLRDALTSYRIQEDLMYSRMVSRPASIDYSYWDLPVPPRLLDDDVTFAGYIRRLNLPEVDPEKAILPEEELRKTHWLHLVGGAIHFSQAYVSSNWYQGGNNHLSLLFNFNWNVQLNQVYHPNLLFQSALTYKLGLNSTPQDEVHSYSISEDLLQYNLNTGMKAFKKWYYSFNMLFKTQILRNYEQNSMKRKASFLSPGDFNLGLGMAYNTENKKKTFQLTATISPISYNLKTCITDKIDHGQFNIKPTRKSRSEAGSNGEVNMTWKIMPNINYKSRIFLFTDYKYFLSDWENTVSFDINKFLSTQIYVHLRYDTSTDKNTAWKNFMMREVLSFGLSYAWSTK